MNDLINSELWEFEEFVQFTSNVFVAQLKSPIAIISYFDIN